MIPNVHNIVASNSESAAAAAAFYKSGFAPQNVQVPYATWFFVYGEPADTLAEAPAADRFTIQVDCWASTTAGVDALYVILSNCFEAAGYVKMIADQRDPSTGRFRKSMQVSLWNLRV